MKKVLRRVKSFSLILLVVLLALGVTGAIISSFIKPIIADTLSQQLQVPVTLSKVNAGFFKHFPYYSVTLQDVHVPEFPRETGKPLLKARQVGVSFNPFDLIRGDYTIKRFHVSDGIARIGSNNFHILKPANASDSSETASFELSKVDLKRVRLIVCEGQDELEQWSIDHLSSRWNVTPEQISFNAVGSALTQSKWLEEVPQLMEKEIEFDLKGAFAPNFQSLSLSTSKVKLEEQALFLKGDVRWEQETDISLEVEAPTLRSGLIREWLPDVDWSGFGDPEILSDLVAKGQFQYREDQWKLDLNLSGESTQLSLKNLNEHLVIQDLKTSLSVTDQSFQMEVDCPSATYQGKETALNLKYADFPSEQLSIQVEKQLPLELLRPFIEDIPMKGVLSVEGIFLDMSPNAKGDLIVDDLAANVDLSGVQVKVDGIDYEFKSGKLISSGKNLELLRAVVHSDVGDAKGTISLSDINYFLVPGLDAALKGECTITGYKYPLESSSGSSGQEADGSSQVEDQLTVDLKLNLKDCNYEGVVIERASGLVQMIPGQWALTGLEVDAFGGTILGNLNGKTREDELTVQGGVSFNQVDLKTLFQEMNNFGQTELTHDNIGGNCKGDLQLTGLWIDGEFISNRLKVVADLEVTDGQLMNYETLTSLSDFVDLEELKDVKFKRLNNTITIDSGNIYIPKMSIFNTAMSLEVSGVHRFDNYVDYRFEVSLVEVLAKRAGWARRRKEKRFREERNGGLTAFISMVGPLEDPEISYDKKAFKKRVKENLREEGKELKETFSGESTGDDGYSWDE
jgi:uncharacterized protein involved in outer membrane biogenesis